MPEPSLHPRSEKPSPAAARPKAGGKSKPRQAESSSQVMPFAAGMAAGLLVSGLVAFYILTAPLPFVDKGLRKPDANTAKPAPAVVAPVPETPITVPSESALGREEVAKPAATPPAEPLGTEYYLQVAAFRSPPEADQMRARLAILGFEAAITQIRRDNEVLYRVRLGPYKQFDELNRVKAALSESSVESTVIRVLPESQ